GHHAGVVIHEVIGENVGGDLHHSLKIASGHRFPRFLQRAADVDRSERLDIDRTGRIASLLQELFRRVVDRIHLQNQSATGDDLVVAPRSKQRERLLKRGAHAVFDSGRESGVSGVISLARWISRWSRDYSNRSRISL